VAERVWFPSTSGPQLAGLVDQPEGRIRLAPDDEQVLAQENRVSLDVAIR
jgi:hypothetical protein